MIIEINDDSIILKEDNSNRHLLSDLLIGAIFTTKEKIYVYMVISLNDEPKIGIGDALSRTHTPVLNLNTGKFQLMDNDTYVII